MDEQSDSHERQAARRRRMAGPLSRQSTRRSTPPTTSLPYEHRFGRLSPAAIVGFFVALLVTASLLGVLITYWLSH